MSVQECPTSSQVLKLLGLVISPVDEAALAAAKARNEILTKPQGSLGRLEEIACRLAALPRRLAISPALMVTVAGDHGVAAQGVSPYPQSVTRQMVENFLAGGAAINALTRSSGMELAIVDAGCAGGPFPSPQVKDLRLGDGTQDMTQGPAMDWHAALEGLSRGAELAVEAVGRGVRCLGIGEMGIANTTSASALYCVLCGLDPRDAVGPGTGACADMVAHKAEVIAKALKVNGNLLAQREEDGSVRPLAALAAVGGFEIAVMAGIVLGGAASGVPVLVDGFISSAAFAVAVSLCPAVADWCFVSHASAEPAHVPAMERLAARTPHPAWARPLLSLGMRLGEGTGAAVAYSLLRAGAAFYTSMATFEEAGVSGKE